MRYIQSYNLFEKKELRFAPRIQPPNKIVSKDELDKYDIPEEIKDMMKEWDVIQKSPYSDSFYSSTDISWGHKPDGSYRVSDHWNFQTRGNMHCQTTKPVTCTSYISIGQYDSKTGRYTILKSLPTKKFLKKKELAGEKVLLNKDPNRIEAKKIFKERVRNKEIYIKLEYKGEFYEGIIRKYTGYELKIEDKEGNIVFNDNYIGVKFRKTDKIELFDKDGNVVENPFGISTKVTEMKHLKTYEGLFDVFRKNRTQKTLDKEILIELVKSDLDDVNFFGNNIIDNIFFKSGAFKSDKNGHPILKNQTYFNQDIKYAHDRVKVAPPFSDLTKKGNINEYRPY